MLNDWVTPTGGLYLFVPSVTFLWERFPPPA